MHGLDTINAAQVVVDRGQRKSANVRIRDELNHCELNMLPCAT